MIPLYVLGILQRFGPQHGYQIKKTIAKQLSDFTQIKLPTIYYHLEKMQKEGFLLATNEKSGSRPEKTIYSITEKGIEKFNKMLLQLMDFEYRPTFPTDGIFYFSEYLEKNDIIRKLKEYMNKLEKIINYLEAHKTETLKFVPNEFKPMVTIIFSHHLKHYQAELDWAAESFNFLQKEDL